MNKSIIDNMSDSDIIAISKKSKTFKEFTAALGYSQAKVGKNTRLKIKKRLNSLGIDFNNTAPQKQVFSKLDISTEELGFLGEASLMNLAVSLGIRVSRPVVDAYPYDFILEKDNKFFKFQVKTSQRYDGLTTTFGFLSNHHNGKCKKYSISDTDYFYLYNVILHEGYIVKNDGVSTCITIRHNSKYIQNTMNIAENLLAEKIINTIF